MTSPLHAIQLFILLCTFEQTVGRSCRYDNLHAVFDWTVIKSPGYPGKFPAQTQCHWKVTAPPQYRVQLEFTDFNLVKPNKDNRCVWQWLNVIEGGLLEDEVRPPMLTLCGTNRPRIVISRSNSINLNLHSNSALGRQEYRGFSVKYKYTKEIAFMPESMSNLPSETISQSHNSNGQRSSASISNSGLSIGDLIGTSKPKPPPNPNAVLTLQNKRTEERNRMRNNGVNAENNMQQNGEFYYNEKRRTAPTIPTLKPLSNKITSQDKLPPRRSKPLPHEIKILLIVLGTVGAIALILYLVKRYAYDKAHKKGSGKLMHAYSHFRKFKKKGRKNEDHEKNSKVNTIAGSTNGTLHSQDSGLATSTEHTSHKNDMVLHATRKKRLDEHSHDVKSGIQNATLRNHHEDPEHMPSVSYTSDKRNRRAREDVDINRKNRTTIRKEHENSLSSGKTREDDDSQRRKRRRRHHKRSSSLEKAPLPAQNSIYPTRAGHNKENGKRQTKNGNNRPRDDRGDAEVKYERDHKTRTRTRKNERRRAYSVSSTSSYERSQTRTWRDKAYS